MIQRTAPFLASLLVLALGSCHLAHAASITSVPERQQQAQRFARHGSELFTLLHEGSIAQPRREDLLAWTIQETARLLDCKAPLLLSGRPFDPRTVTGEELRKGLDVTKANWETDEGMARLLEATFPQVAEDHQVDAQALLCWITPNLLQRFDRWGSFEPKPPVFICGGPWDVGVGLYLKEDPSTQRIRVITPMKDGPGYQVGIRAGDIITQITQVMTRSGQRLVRPETTSTSGLSLKKALQRIKGPSDTEVRLTIRRKGVDHPLTFTMKRKGVATKSVLGWKRKRDHTWEHWLDRKNKIAYLRITSFNPKTTRQTQKVVKTLLADNMRGLILDLRFCPGGLLVEVIDTAGLFISAGEVMTVKACGPLTATLRSDGKSTLPSFPMVCLINRETASAGEILAACLQDHKRARLVGERTYGRGCVQNRPPFMDGTLALTTASFLRPSGKKLDRGRLKGHADEEWGVTPDPGHTIELSNSEQRNLQDYFERVTWIHVRPVAYDRIFQDQQRHHALEVLRRGLPGRKP